MWPSRNFGVLTITLVQMMVDLSLFAIFFSVVLSGFCFALVGLSETADHHTHLIGEGHVVRTGVDAALHAGSDGKLALVWQPFWAMFAEFDIEELSSVPFGLPLMWVYVLIANVVLVNMLIAMFADTYTRIKMNAEIEYRYQRFLHIFEYQHVVHHLPPPFNAPLLLLDSCRSCCGTASERERNIRMDFEVFDGDMNMYGSSGVIGMQGGTPLSRKFVQRYLKKHTDMAAQTSQQGMAARMEKLVNEMEERLQHEVQHLKNTITSPASSSGASPEVSRQLRLIAAAIDRLSKGEASKQAAPAAPGLKEAMRGAQPPPSNGHSVPSASSSTPNRVGSSTPPRSGRSKTNRPGASARV